MTEEDIRGLLREMREDSVPADSRARVRMRIAERTAARRRRKLAGWVMAPLCVLVLALALRSPAPRRIPLPAPPPVRIERAVMRSEPPAQTVRRKQVARRTAKPQVLIRIETPDPEVVILLIGN